MIIFKENVYSRRDERVEWDKDILHVVIEKSSAFERDYNDLSIKSLIPRIRLLIKDIKNNFIYSDGPNGGDTHYLSDFSKPGRFLIYSKSISVVDRLNYAIYEPDEEGVSKIVLMRCKGHGLLGRKGYSELEN